MLTPANDAFETLLRAQLPESSFRPLTPAYLEEPRGRFSSQGGLLIAPRDVEQVSTVIRACAAAKVGVVPYGGGTGLVGGQVLPEGPAPVILSLERMTQIRAVFPEENVLIAEAGAILQNVQAAAEEVGRLFPLSLASEGSCRIGGNLATNAGGVNVLRYGNTRDLCLGLEAVLPDGEIWNGLTRLRKDNTGYDVRNLLIGAEGTLGVITAATLKLFPRPAEQGTALFVVNSPSDALKLLAIAQDVSGGGVSAFELIHRTGLDFLAKHLPDVRVPFDQMPEWSVLVDLGLPAAMSAAGILENIFEQGLDAGLVTDGLVAQSETQRQEFWSVREHIPQANSRVGAISSHDISLPLGAIPEFLEVTGQAVSALGKFRINSFGHLGDGNLHYNVFPPEGQKKEAYSERRDEIKGLVHDLVHEFEGSFSAEHGIGRLKTDDLLRYGSPAKIALMRMIKTSLDPHGIMNPGVIFSKND